MIKNIKYYFSIVFIFSFCFYIYINHGGLFVSRKIANRLFSDAPRKPSDFYQFWAAARDFRAGRSIYTPLVESAFRHQASLGHAAFDSSGMLPVNAYPPFTTLVFLPFSWLNYSTAYDLWAWCSIGMVAASVLVIVIHLDRRLPWWRRAVVGTLACAVVAGSASLKHEVETGNVGGLLFLLISLAWAADKRGNPTWSGLFASLAFLIKLYPGLLFLYFWFADRAAFWRMVAWTILLGSIGLIVVGWEDHVNFVRGLSRSEIWYNYTYNHSEFGYWYRLFMTSSTNQKSIADSFSTSPLLDSPRLAKFLSFGSAALATFILIWAGRRASGRGRIATQGLFAMTTVGMVLVSPISWPSSLLLLILPMAILLDILEQKGTPLKGAVLLRGLIMAAALVLWFYPTMWEWRLRSVTSRPYTPWDSITHLGFKTYAILGLYAIAGWMTMQLSTDPEHGSNDQGILAERPGLVAE
jgi:Glycosyltransferase family 87